MTGFFTFLQHSLKKHFYDEYLVFSNKWQGIQHFTAFIKKAFLWLVLGVFKKWQGALHFYSIHQKIISSLVTWCFQKMTRCSTFLQHSLKKHSMMGIWCFQKMTRCSTFLQHSSKKHFYDEYLVFSNKWQGIQHFYSMQQKSISLIGTWCFQKMTRCSTFLQHPSKNNFFYSYLVFSNKWKGYLHLYCIHQKGISMVGIWCLQKMTGFSTFLQHSSKSSIDFSGKLGFFLTESVRNSR